MNNEERSDRTTPDWLLAGALAAGAFLAAYLFIDIILPVSLVIAALFLVSGLFIFRRKLPHMEEKEADLESSLAEGRRKLAEIEALRKQVRDRAVAAKIDSIEETIRKILAEIKRDPGDLKTARQFLSYYLDATITILAKYVKLSAQGVDDQGIRNSLARTGAMLDTIGAAFEKQLARLLTNDVMDLDTELSLLEKTIKLEGLGE